MAQPPTAIRALRDAGILELLWPGSPATTSRIPFKVLRCECPCASCIEEWSGQRLIDPDKIPNDVRPTEMSFSGNYALKFAWSDGHNTGLYTWEQLAAIAHDYPAPVT
jgi:DUF971 family protein